MLTALALAVVTITPPYQELDVYGGLCSAKVRIYVPSHPDNRLLRIQVSDGMVDSTGKAVVETEIPLNTRPEEQTLVYTLYKDGHIAVSAFVEGPDRKVRGTAVSYSICGPQSTGKE